ncbi:MAG: S41 family peptidase [Myxococcota bacterium]
MPRWALGLLVCLTLGCAHRATPTAEPPGWRAPARDRATSIEHNLIAFARLYGYVRFFHPTDASHDADWRRLAVVGVQQVRQARTNDELAQRLESLFGPLAPTLALWVDGEPPPAEPAVPTRRDGLVYWQYQGFVGSQISLYSPPYTKVRVQPEKTWRRRFTEAPAPDTRVQTELAPGLWMRLPVVLSAAQAERTTGAPPPSLRPDLDLDRDHDALAIRQAAVIEVWNVLRHFYPYQHELSLDWAAMLKTSLRDAEDDSSVDDVRNTLRGLLAPLEDGHGYVGHRGQGRQATLPIRLELVEGQPVITGTRDPEQLAVGDVVLEIGDAPARAQILGLAQRLSGTPQWRNFRAAAWEIPRALFGDRIELLVERDGRPHRVEVEAERAPTPLPPRPPAIHTFDDGIAYVDLTRAEWSQIEVVLPELASARGVVFDLRGYPTHNDTILDHLLDEPEDTLWMHVPRVVEPDGEVVGWHDLGWHRRPAAPHIEAPVTFLISAEAISYAESMLSYVEAHELGTLVGTATAGANGDIVRLDTLGGFYVIFSGMRVTRHNGRPFHGGGVEPDIEVHRTIAGLRAGRDEVLDAARQHLREATPSGHVAGAQRRRSRHHARRAKPSRTG